MRRFIAIIFIFCIGILFSGHTASSKETTYDQSTPEALGQAYIKAVNSDDKEGLKSLIHPDVLKYAKEHGDEKGIENMINREIEHTVPGDLEVEIADYNDAPVDPKYVFYPDPVKEMRLNWSQEIPNSLNKKAYGVFHSLARRDNKWYITIPLFTEAGEIKFRETVKEQEKKYKQEVQAAVSLLLNTEGKTAREINNAVNAVLNYKLKSQIVEEKEVIDDKLGKKHLEKHYRSPDLGIVLIYIDGAFDRATKIE